MKVSKDAVIYLSGKMSGLPDNNHSTFYHYASLLRQQGYTVINPAEITITDKENPTWSDWMRKDIVELMKADVVATIPGWEDSRGASLEVYIARQLDMPVYNVEDLLITD